MAFFPPVAESSRDWWKRHAKLHLQAFQGQDVMHYREKVQIFQKLFLTIARGDAN